MVWEKQDPVSRAPSQELDSDSRQHPRPKSRWLVLFRTFVSLPFDRLMGKSHEIFCCQHQGCQIMKMTVVSCVRESPVGPSEYQVSLNFKILPPLCLRQLGTLYQRPSDCEIHGQQQRTACWRLKNPRRRNQKLPYSVKAFGFLTCTLGLHPNMLHLVSQRLQERKGLFSNQFRQQL